MPRGRPPEGPNQRSEDMIELYEYGFTLKDISEDYGVSWQRVEQILIRKHYDRYYSAKVDRISEKFNRDFEKAQAKWHSVVCPVCGDEFDTNDYTFVYCSEEHYKIMVEHFRNVINPIPFRLANAHKDLRKSTDPKVRARAQRVIDTGGTQPNREYLYGKTLEYALEAYKNNWPIFDKFYPPYQKYIREYVERGGPVASYRTPARWANKTCAVCGIEFNADFGRATYCSEEHYNWVDRLRYVLDPVGARLRSAATTLRNAKSSDRRVAWAKRVFESNGANPSKIHLVGKTREIAVQIYMNGWPLFEKFDPDYQQYIREYVERTNDEENK